MYILGSVQLCSVHFTSIFVRVFFLASDLLPGSSLAKDKHKELLRSQKAPCRVVENNLTGENKTGRKDCLPFVKQPTITTQRKSLRNL